MSRRSERCVIPKTTDAITAKMPAAPKCESCSGCSKLFFLPQSDVVRIHRGHDIQEPGDDDELCSVIRSRHHDRSCTPACDTRNGVERTRAQVPYEAKNVENIAYVPLVNMAIHQHTQGKHQRD